MIDRKLGSLNQIKYAIKRTGVQQGGFNKIKSLSKYLKMKMFNSY